MSDLFERVTGDQDIFKKLLSKIPGFSGYIERSNRRQADQILRQAVAQRYEDQWQRISGLQRDLISTGGIAYVDDMEAAAIKLRQFIDRVRTASYGYSGFFDAVKINEEELAQVYQYDLALLDAADEVKNAVDNVETSMGTDGLPAAIRHLTAIAQQSVDAYNRRSEVMIGGITGSAQ
ncbi:hypothetical protein [Levilinea saccharolytica]|uniref:Uncharacterized protein n=1 Tax=Levilinea saccharolytica TaxID=229921 RepID=A0A0P6YBM7_9CHLR|nr:hypothetical protein [Levilinea saccharolytica]KPL86863.1 hypothetical protein ADN01_05255 [Levilinea saccharolytica]GAP17768.1 hypothetical protein LSAC_01643 [Levilinea saccharolytica]